MLSRLLLLLSRPYRALLSLWPAGIVALALVLATGYGLAALNTAGLHQQLIARFGVAHVDLLDAWLREIDSAKTLGENARLRHVNDFINRRIAFDSDISVWGQSDYWATPLETIGQGAGDCEDFAIIKYVALRLAGVPSHKLRLIYVKARMNTPNGPMPIAHMVLAYYASPTAEPAVLDNLNPAILPASKRNDLQPVFSFNSEGIFAGVSGQEAASTGGIGRLSRWEDAWRRILAEGYEF